MGERIKINYNNKVVTSLWEYYNDTSLFRVDVDTKQHNEVKWVKSVIIHI
jgi:hypothetical protein